MCFASKLKDKLNHLVFKARERFIIKNVSSCHPSFSSSICIRPKPLQVDTLNDSYYSVQGLSVPFACVGSGDPARVLRLYTTNTLDNF